MNKIFFTPQFKKQIEQLKKNSKKDYIKILNIIEKMSQDKDYIFGSSLRPTKLREDKYDKIYSLRLNNRDRVLFLMSGQDEITFIEVVDPH